MAGCDRCGLSGIGLATHGHGEPCKSRLRLEAAAPDMLAALEDIIQRNEIQHWFNLDKARAAVAKAKG